LTKEFKGYSPDNVVRGMEVYNFFGYLWVTQFLVAICQTTVAGAIGSWYWVREKKEIPAFPVLSSFYRVVRYHLGSMAFGSLIIAIVKFIRAMLAWLQRRLKGAQFAPLVLFLKCLSCCFAVYERFLKFLNKNAYIMVT
jgi:choline transporter-like protein 2/4/5